MILHPLFTRRLGLPERRLARLMHPRKSTSLLWLILGLALIRGVIYESVIPPWQAPDEPKHFEYVALLQQEGHLVTRKDTSLPLEHDIISSMKAYDYWRFGYANGPQETASSFTDIWKRSPSELDRPPLYYLAASMFYHLFRDMPIDVQLYVVRLFSVLLGVLTVLMSYLTVKTVFPKDPLIPVLGSGFVVLLPMHTFISSSVNSDNLANLIAAAIAYAIARIFVRGVSLRNALGVLLLLLAGSWTKRTVFFAAPLAAISVPIYLGTRRFHDYIRIALVALFASATAFALLLALDGPRTWITWYLDRYVFNSSAAINLSRFAQNDYSLWSLLGLYSSFAGRVFDSFWAQFGWMSVRLDNIWYAVILILSLLPLLGLLNLGRLLALKREELDKPQLKLMAIYLLWIFVVVGVTFIQYTADYSTSSFPQGRYMFPALVPLAVYCALGLKYVVPRYFQPIMTFLAIGSLLLFDSLSLILYVLPYYY